MTLKKLKNLLEGSYFRKSRGRFNHVLFPPSCSPASSNYNSLDKDTMTPKWYPLTFFLISTRLWRKGKGLRHQPRVRQPRDGNKPLWTAHPVYLNSQFFCLSTSSLTVFSSLLWRLLSFITFKMRFVLLSTMCCLLKQNMWFRAFLH